VVGPEAMIEDLGKDAAVWVIPTSDGGGVSAVQGILKDGIVWIE